MTSRLVRGRSHARSRRQGPTSSASRRPSSTARRRRLTSPSRTPTKVVLDYVKELRKALAARKLKYRFLGVGSWTDAELPSGNPPNMDIRLNVRDALLVRTDRKIKILRVARGQYAKTTSLFGGFVIAKRGWVFADASIAGRRFRVITTHLESFNDESNVEQGRELATIRGYGRPRRRSCSATSIRARMAAPDADLRQSARRRLPRCVGAGASERRRADLLLRRRLARVGRAVLQPHRLRAHPQRLPRRRRGNRRREAARSHLPDSGRRITPVSGPGCGCPS